MAARFTFKEAAVFQAQLLVKDIAGHRARGAQHQIVGVDRAGDIAKHRDALGDGIAIHLAALFDGQRPASDVPDNRSFDDDIAVVIEKAFDRCRMRNDHAGRRMTEARLRCHECDAPNAILSDSIVRKARGNIQARAHDA